MFNKSLLVLVLTSLLAGCGADSVDEEVKKVTPVTYTGVFLDSAVSGLNYKTASQIGTTNEKGEFSFQDDELITFSIGGIQLPAITAKIYLTPLSIFETNNYNDTDVVNLLRLLQSLDTDGDASNGIEIADSVHQLAENLTLDFSADDFEQQTADLISQSGAVNQSIISSQMAIDHFQITLNELDNNTVTSCGTSHDNVGYSGYFTTLAHNVSGKATIIDDCTIEITEFTYDGGGPAVYFYGAINHNYSSEQAFPMGAKLSGIVYEGTSITLKLPQNATLDDLTGISVWCVDFNANFGEMTFTP